MSPRPARRTALSVRSAAGRAPAWMRHARGRLNSGATDAVLPPWSGRIWTSRPHGSTRAVGGVLPGVGQSPDGAVAPLASCRWRVGQERLRGNFVWVGRRYETGQFGELARPRLSWIGTSKSMHGRGSTRGIPCQDRYGTPQNMLQRGGSLAFRQDVGRWRRQTRRGQDSMPAREVFEHLPHGIAVTDRVGAVITWNRALEEMLELDDDALGRTCCELFGCGTPSGPQGGCLTEQAIRRARTSARGRDSGPDGSSAVDYRRAAP